jgi:hypothetical protein
MNKSVLARLSKRYMTIEIKTDKAFPETSILPLYGKGTEEIKIAPQLTTTIPENIPAKRKSSHQSGPGIPSSRRELAEHGIAPRKAKM